MLLQLQKSGLHGIQNLPCGFPVDPSGQLLEASLLLGPSVLFALSASRSVCPSLLLVDEVIGL